MVSVLDKYKRPLDPCSEKRARLLLERGRAIVHRIHPVFTIILKDRSVENSVVHPLRAGIDPGSKMTGISLSMPLPTGEKAIALIHLEHRGDQIRANLTQRRMFRRSRRNRKTRYREPRFLNRIRPEGWLPSSIRHRVESIKNLVIKLKKFFNIDHVNVETAKFDTQRMQNPEISGIEYQQGTLQGWDVREYILEKFGHKCVYCGKTNTPFEIDHVISKSKGGSDRVSNLVLACHECNHAKDDRDLEEFCPEKAEKIKKQLKTPLKDAAAMNAIRYKIAEELKSLVSVLTASFGSRTKFNRKQVDVPKEHCLDALFSGETRNVKNWEKLPILAIRCMGRGKRSRTLLDRHGFPRAYLPRKKSFFGFKTGDIVKAVVGKGKKAGVYVGRVAVRANGYFNINTGNTLIQGLNHKWFRLIQSADGYLYSLTRPDWRRISSPA